MIEPLLSPAHTEAFRRAHKARATAFGDMVRAIFSDPSAARPEREVTTEEGAGRARPAPAECCA